MLTATDEDLAGVILNLSTARKGWVQMLRILGREGVNVQVSCMFYKTMVQDVLLYGSEMWVLAPWVFQTFVAFHHRVVCWLTG